jgi:hypothetical protein
LSIARELKSLVKQVKELVALWHWFSNLIAFLTAISEHGITEGVILWLISSLISAFIAELIKTLIPSFLRPVFRYFIDWN